MQRTIRADSRDFGSKTVTIDRPIEDALCLDPIVAERRHQSRRQPMSMIGLLALDPIRVPSMFDSLEVKVLYPA